MQGEQRTYLLTKQLIELYDVSGMTVARRKPNDNSLDVAQLDMNNCPQRM